MNNPYLFSVTNHVATFSVNDAPFNLMPVDYIDRLEEQLPEVIPAATDDGENQRELQRMRHRHRYRPTLGLLQHSEHRREKHGEGSLDASLDVASTWPRCGLDVGLEIALTGDETGLDFSPDADDERFVSACSPLAEVVAPSSGVTAAPGTLATAAPSAGKECSGACMLASRFIVPITTIMDFTARIP